MISNATEIIKEQQGSAVSMTFMKRLVRLFDGCDIQVQFDRPQHSEGRRFQTKGNNLYDKVENYSSSPGSTIVVEDRHFTHSLLHLQRFNGDELVSGSVLLSPRGSTYAHLGIRIELRGIITVQYAAPALSGTQFSSSSGGTGGSSLVVGQLPSGTKSTASSPIPETGDVEVSSTFLCQGQTYEAGTIQLPTRFPFQFGAVKPFESYVGHRIQIHYMIYVKIFRSFKNISHREHIFVTWPSDLSLPSSQMETGQTMMSERDNDSSTTLHGQMRDIQTSKDWEQPTLFDQVRGNSTLQNACSTAHVSASATPSNLNNKSNSNPLVDEVSFRDSVETIYSPCKNPLNELERMTNAQALLSSASDSPVLQSATATLMAASRIIAPPMMEDLITTLEKNFSSLTGDPSGSVKEIGELDLCSPHFAESTALDRIRYGFLCRQYLWSSLFPPNSRETALKQLRNTSVILMGVRDNLLLDFSFFPAVVHLEDEIMGEVKLRKVHCHVERAEISLIREEFMLSSDSFREELQDGFDSHANLANSGSGVANQRNVSGLDSTGKSVPGGTRVKGKMSPGWQKEMEKLQIFEILDGCPRDGAVIPFRLQLATIPNLTPTYDSIYNGRASVKYYLSLTIITKEKRYFKEQEIKVYRRKGQECTTRPQILIQ